MLAMSRVSSFLSCVLLAILFVCQSTLAQEAEQQSSTTLSVYHQKDGQYIKRGEIVGLPGYPEYIPTNNEIVEFKSNKDAYYQIKLKDERTGNILLQSVRMCQMVASDWSDEFVLNLDENNQFYYFSYYAGSDYCEKDIKYPIVTKPFTTSIKVKTPIPGPKPLVGNFASQKKTQQTKSKKPTAKVNDEIPDEKEIEEKSFFQKYWYLILGGAFMLMTMGGAPEQAGTRR
ncbi:hypothetical protein MBANPS3_005322 [Mucor bainieri]